MGVKHLSKFPITFQGRDFKANLICVATSPYDIILGMDWLTCHGAAIDFRTRTVTVDSGTHVLCEIQGRCDFNSGKLVSAMAAFKLLRQGCVDLLCYLGEPEKEDIIIDNIPVVREYADVFPEEILGLPPIRDVEFTIDL